MEAAQAGDRDALDALLRRHHDRIHAVCRRLAGNEADALDATQEALIAIVRGLPRFDGRAAFSTWAYRVATNACLDELRRRGRRAVPGPPGGPDGAPGRAAVTGRRRHRGARRPAGHRRRTGRSCPRSSASPVVLRDLCDLDYAEIADALGIPPGTVRSRIARGRALLAASLGGNREPGRGRPTDGPTGADQP